MINATVTEIYDMNTHIGKVGLIGLHTPRTDLLLKHLFGLYTQFKKWRYNGARITLIPSAQLPADIAGVAYEGGDQMVDPRDVFNPILHKGFTGESLGAFLDNYMDPNNHRGASIEYNTPGAANDGIDDSGKADDVTAYYQMLTQGDFKKMMPMGSIRNKWIYPMVYDVASTRQILGAWNGTYVNRGEGVTLNSPMSEIDTSRFADGDQSKIFPVMRPGSSVNTGFQSHTPVIGLDRYGYDGEYVTGVDSLVSPQFLTPRKRKLGWMDTLQKVLPVGGSLALTDLNYDYDSEPFQFAQLPKLYEYLLVTPPSYYSKLYYRLIIHHSVSFAGLRSATGAGTAISSKDVEYNNFMEQLPTEANVATSASVDVLGGDVTPVTDGMQGSIV